MNAVNRITGVLLCLWCGVASADLTVRIPGKVGEHQLAVISVQADEGLEVDVEIWRSLDQAVPFRELKATTGREFGFVAPPGEYLVRVYGWKAGSVEKYSGKVVIGGDPQPEPGPIDPVEPDDTLTGLAKISRDAALKVFSVTREAEAQAIAQVYRSVASQAAALSNMTTGQMTEQIRAGNRRVLSDDARNAWGQWAAEIAKQLEPVSDKVKLIEAYRAIAEGLEAVK